LAGFWPVLGCFLVFSGVGFGSVFGSGSGVPGRPVFSTLLACFGRPCRAPGLSFLGFAVFLALFSGGFRPLLGLFWGCFRALPRSFRPRSGWLSFVLVPFWAPFPGPVLGCFWVVLACFRPFFGLPGPRAPKPAYQPPLALLVFPVFRPFSGFWPLLGPPGPPRPFLGFTARCFWGPSALFRPFWRPPFGGRQNTPSRGLPSALRPPNVPLLAPFGGPPSGAPQSGRPVAYSRPSGPQMYHFPALFGLFLDPPGPGPQNQAAFFSVWRLRRQTLKNAA